MGRYGPVKEIIFRPQLSHSTSHHVGSALPGGRRTGQCRAHVVGDVEWLSCGRKMIFFTGPYRPFLFFYGPISDFPLHYINRTFCLDLSTLGRSSDFYHGLAITPLVVHDTGFIGDDVSMFTRPHNGIIGNAP